jgi:tRNA(fMet)-specific endonuclease VapC
MPRMMLDTNVVSDLLRDPHGARHRLLKLGEEGLAVSLIVVAEIRFGIFKKRSERLSRQFEAILPSLDVLSWEAPADREYGRLRVALEQAGEPIGSNDMFIAAHALALVMPLVTANIDEFSRVPGLAVVHWR